MMATNTQQPVRRRGKSTSLVDIIGGYRFDPLMSRTQRLAHFLDWLAKEAPFQACPGNMALRAIMGYARTPRQDTDEVQSLLGVTSAARSVLMKTYGRGLYVVRDVGMRATVDDEDCAQTQQRSNVKRLMSAHRRVKETQAIIDPSKIRDEKVKRWVTSGVTNALKALDADDRLTRLLPPAQEPKE